MFLIVHKRRWSIRRYTKPTRQDLKVVIWTVMGHKVRWAGISPIGAGWWLVFDTLLFPFEWMPQYFFHRWNYFIWSGLVYTLYNFFLCLFLYACTSIFMNLPEGFMSVLSIYDDQRTIVFYFYMPWMELFCKTDLNLMKKDDHCKHYCWCNILCPNPSNGNFFWTAASIEAEIKHISTFPIIRHLIYSISLVNTFHIS